VIGFAEGRGSIVSMLVSDWFDQPEKAFQGGARWQECLDALKLLRLSQLFLHHCTKYISTS